MRFYFNELAIFESFKIEVQDLLIKQEEMKKRDCVYSFLSEQEAIIQGCYLNKN